MNNEVNNKKVLLSDDELQQVAGGAASCQSSVKQQCNSYKNKLNCEKYGCAWIANGDYCDMLAGEMRDLLVPVIS